MRMSETAFRDYHDLAEVLTEQFNGVANASEDFFPINQDFVHQQLDEMFEPSDLEYMVDDDFARGVIMGMIYMTAMLQQDEAEGLDTNGQDS